MASLDWSHCPVVESVHGKMSGAWVSKGTRMPVSAIFENPEAGANIDDIMQWFDGLDREQVKAVKSPFTLGKCGFFSMGRRPCRFVLIRKVTRFAQQHSKFG